MFHIKFLPGFVFTEIKVDFFSCQRNTSRTCAAVRRKILTAGAIFLLFSPHSKEMAQIVKYENNEKQNKIRLTRKKNRKCPEAKVEQKAKGTIFVDFPVISLLFYISSNVPTLSRRVSYWLICQKQE